MSQRRKIWFLSTLAALALLWLNNTSLFSAQVGEPVFVAHRGHAQQMHPEHESYRKCLSRIHEPEHTFIENTIPSIEAAFEYGAAFVEIDLRRTADGSFAVFHDDDLSCKTEASGLVSDYTMQQLKGLDVGYGYVTDDGRHPLRGQGKRLMPSLEEVLKRFPTQGFVINVKDDLGKLSGAAAQLAAVLSSSSKGELLIIGNDSTVRAVQQADPALIAASRASARRCLRDYTLLGWTGFVPGSCRNTITGMYVNLGWVLWGWPHRFVNRMAEAGTTVMLMHPHQRESIHDLPETPEYARQIPAGYSGAVVTNRIDKIQEWMKSGD